MTDLSDLFWQATLQDIKQGYLYQPETEEFVCLICGKHCTHGRIYTSNDQLYEAHKFIQLHIASEHRSPFHFLLSLDKKITGLTQHQKTLLELFYAGANDQEIAKTLQTNSTSTIRNHRFALREKQKQAKVFLAIMELLAARTPKKQAFIDIPRSSQNVDDRFAITEQENAKILAAAFPQGLDGPLAAFPAKEKKRVAIIRHLLHYFQVNRSYTEKEINEQLKPIYKDYAILRRYLIEYGFMDRTPDGASYWIKI